MERTPTASARPRQGPHTLAVTGLACATLLVTVLTPHLLWPNVSPPSIPIHVDPNVDPRALDAMTRGLQVGLSKRRCVDTGVWGMACRCKHHGRERLTENR